jgi:ornithine cyclodeaminase/alanine dehydrogenase-like protein (mu-crystallin family)
VFDPDDPVDQEDVEEPAPSARRPPMYFRLLNEADVAGLLSIDELVDAMKGALVQFSTGKVVQPVRAVLPVGTARSFFGVMPAALSEHGGAGASHPHAAAIGAKLVTVFPGNASRELPTHMATILLFSAETGALVAVLDGRYITEARTAAVSAVSAVALARDETETLAIVGSGVQARSHVTALETVFDLGEIRVWSRDTVHVGDFIDEMTPITKGALAGAASAEHAVRDADLIVLATSSPEPVIRNEWVKDGAHVISVGACRPTEREMDPALVARGVLYVDSREAALVESGDVVMGIREGRFAASHIAGELGAVIAGTAPGRRSPRDVTIFKSLGLAVEDVVTADLIYRRAVAMDVGQELEL